jgi:hypothetical protein
MTDIILIAVIVAFFAAAAWLVRVLDSKIVRTSEDTGAADEAGNELEPGGRA